MKRMARMSTRKPHSWWWDSHISPKNSKWLAENLEEMDRCVKEMLTSIEEDGDSFAKKAELYYEKRPQLVSHVEDFYRMYRSLAERYDHLTGELRRNIPSELQSQGSGSWSDASSGPPSPSLTPSPELTPERKPPRPKPSPRAAGFDFFLGSGGISDHSRKGSDGFSSSESDSDSDDSKDENGDDDSSALHRRILELENQLRDERVKIHEHEKGSNGQCEQLENGDHVDCCSRISALEKELVATDEKLQFAEAEISSLEQKLAVEKKQIPELEELIAVSEAEISHYKQEIEDLKRAMAATTRQSEADLSHRDLAIEESKMVIASLSKTLLQEKTSLEEVIEELKREIEQTSQKKSLLEAKATEQERMLHKLEADSASAAERLLQERSALEAEVSRLSQSHASLDAEFKLLEDEIKRLEADKTRSCAENGKRIEELNKNLDILKLRADMLTSEKEELGAKVNALIADVKCRDDQIYRMDEQLHQLRSEHARLIAEMEDARRSGEELRSRTKELEEEVERQRVVILDGAEGKREVIRQLCFSIEHYRDGYHQLRQAVLQRHKRPAIISI